MLKVSLTYFVDFVLKSGTPKVTVVRNFKESGDYDPSADFYKKIREAIVALHEKGGAIGDLSKVLSGLTDEKKQAAYPALIAGHKKFIGKKKPTWFKPPTATWTAGGLSITVNPELGLEVDGTRTVLKMYFKEEQLQKKRSEIIAHVMNQTLSPVSAAGTKFGLLDVRRGKVIAPPIPVKGHDALLAGEAASFATIYASL
jgi:hypothetical protein